MLVKAALTCITVTIFLSILLTSWIWIPLIIILSPVWIPIVALILFFVYLLLRFTFIGTFISSQISQLMKWIFMDSVHTKRYATKKFYWLASKILPLNFKFMNYGYANLDSQEGKIVELTDQNDEFWRYEIQLYHFLIEILAGKNTLRNLNVIEFGSGRGGGAEYISKKFFPSKYYGFDISKQLIRQCRENYSNLKNLEFDVGDAESSILPAEKMDLVISVQMLHHIGNIQQFILECVRILKVNGELLLCDFIEDQQHLQFLEMCKNEGLELVSQLDITKNVVQALTYTNTRKLTQLRTQFN